MFHKFHNYEMTTSVRFCLSYDPLMGFYSPQNYIISGRKRMVDTDVVSDVTYTHQSVIAHVVRRS